jgi:hypothetical protein
MDSLILDGILLPNRIVLIYNSIFSSYTEPPPGMRVKSQPILDEINLFISDGILLLNRIVLISSSIFTNWVEILSGMSRETIHPG